MWIKMIKIKVIFFLAINCSLLGLNVNKAYGFWQLFVACPHFKFECSSGECIDKSAKCDGRQDCKDGSDEAICAIECAFPEYVNCSNVGCIPRIMACAEQVDCGNEFNRVTMCSRLCEKNKFQCNNNKCIPLSWTCDGKSDCPDGNDEKDGCLNKICEKDQFQCKNKVCIDHTFRCDGFDDCPDKSDEEKCASSASDCTLEKGKFLCKDQSKCLNLTEVCNNVSNCDDHSDEGELCSERSNKCNNCTHTCMPTPEGNICICRPGFILNNNNNTCIDINECNQYDICDQTCVNTPGSYYCSCESPAILQSDGKTCIYKGNGAVLYYSTSAGVHALNLDNFKNYSLGTHFLGTGGVDVSNDYVYWTIRNEDYPAIVRADKNNKEENVITAGLGLPGDLAIDIVTENIYFVDDKYQHIGVCKKDGLVCIVILHNFVSLPVELALSCKHGLMFWSDRGEIPMIGKSGMDGSNPVKFVTENIQKPFSIAVDSHNERLYWFDGVSTAVESIKFDGTDRRIVIERDFLPIIDIYENKLFWADKKTHEISECNKFTGKNLKTLVGKVPQSINNIRVHHPMDYLKVPNPCTYSLCSDLCLLSPSKKSGLNYTCVCPNDKKLSKDGKTCRFSESVYSRKLVAGHDNTLYIFDHNHLGHPSLETIPLNIQSISSMVFNPNNDDIIIADFSGMSSIWSYNLKSKDFKQIIDGGIASIHSMEFDDFGNNLYWCDWQTLTVEALSLQTLNKTTILSGTNSNWPIELALVPEEGFMFVAFATSWNYFRIDRISMDGSLNSRNLFVELNTIGSSFQMYFDRYSKTLIWVVSGKVETVNISTGERTSYFEIKHVGSISFSHNTFFWTTKTNPTIYWRDMHKKAMTYNIKLPMKAINKEIHMLALHKARNSSIIVNSPCHKNNGGCSHLCLASMESSDKKTCACPIELSLSVNNQSCVAPKKCSPKIEFQCHTRECIPLSKVCDTKKDCLHGEDEDITSCPEFVCPKGQFLCHDLSMCIDEKLRCDKKPDCPDQSDEICENTCPKGKFWCESGECIESHFRCDGKVDCKRGFDEIDCKNVNCTKDEFRCLSGQCISKDHHCDGEPDCTDGSDESSYDCEPFTCSSTEFHCTNGKCINKYDICNNVNDCGDNSDESVVICNSLIGKETERTSNIICNPTIEFLCLTKTSSGCVSLSKKCDGVVDCMGGEDEIECSGDCVDDQFQCEQTKRCIRQEYLCDNKNDCGDNSDEVKESCLIKNITGTSCIGFQCKNGKCIYQKNVCDGILDCEDGSDEGGLCDGCKTANCTHKCYNEPKGPKCYCENGFKLGEDNRTCVDIDECQLDICAQSCTNTNGSYVCGCYPEYTLRSDHVSCKANGGRIYHIISTGTDAYLFPNNRNHREKLSLKPSIDSHSEVVISAFDVDNRKSRIYSAWLYSKIQRVDLKEKRIDMRDVTVAITGLAVDWITENIYFLTSSQIYLTSFNHSKSLIIYDSKPSSVITIAVDPVAGYLFWSQEKSRVIHIMRATTSGENEKIIINNECSGKEIVVDSYERHLYYINENLYSIMRSNYEGTFIKEISSTAVPIFSFSFFENIVYYTSEKPSWSQKCQIYGLPPRKCDLIDWPIEAKHKHIKIMQENRQRDVPNSCLNTKCSEFCVVSESGPVCLCGNKEGKSFVCGSGISILKHYLQKERFNYNSSFWILNFAYFILFCFIIGVSYMACHYYRPKTSFYNYRFRFRNQSFERINILSNSHDSGINEAGINRSEQGYLETVMEK